MEKISGIIPSSPRVSAVDLKESSPVRASSPSFGRMEQVSALKEPMRQDAVQKAAGSLKDQLDWRMKDAKQAAVAQEVTDRFFIRNKPSEETRGDFNPPTRGGQALPVVSNFSAKSAPAGFKTDDFGSLRAASKPEMARSPMTDVEDDSPMSAPEGLYPKGSFIDRTA